MAERRSTPETVARATPCLDDWLAAIMPFAGPASWLLRDGDGLVGQPFFVAIDPQGFVCWTDDPARACRFLTKPAADRFALDRMTTETIVVRDGRGPASGRLVAASPC